VLPAKSDYLMVVDSNMISAKTDAVMDKSIRSRVTRGTDGTARVHLELTYRHRSLPMWNITRYKDYVRVYVPHGARLLSSSGFVAGEHSSERGEIDISGEHGKVVFGGFFVVEPKGSKTVSFDYQLPQSVVDSMNGGLYTIFVQKQSGISNQLFSLDLQGLSVARNPYPRQCRSSEASSLVCETDLTIDREFSFPLQ